MSIDVLAVMDRTATNLSALALLAGGDGDGSSDAERDFAIARAALIELIEAARAASFAMADAPDSDYMGQRYRESLEGLRAALARMTHNAEGE